MLKNNLIFNLCDFISVSDPTLTIQKNISQEMKVVVVSMGNPCVYSLVLKTLNVFESEGTCLILQNCHLVKKWPKLILHKIQVRVKNLFGNFF